MSLYFEELDYRPTPIGAISLRRRRVHALGEDVFEILLGEEHLMSSLFTASEIALARLALAALGDGPFDVIVGGLGLGYTAQAVLEHENVRSLTVIEMLEPVIDWHEQGLLPLEPPLSADPRCRVLQGDFFALAASDSGFDPDAPGRLFHAILIDIDHTPDRLLDDRSGGFYTPGGLARLASHLHPGGIVALWSDEGPDDAFVKRLDTVFADVRAEPVVFANPLQEGRPVTQTVYLGHKAS
ncbi:spermidine synthase [Oricola cellulosilytica]|uniref:Spermidine synthase n=1 Tax=Oricola cellulosilytica TaxID=1429082 RepID=A0A4R0PEA5_9HYPH|nr:spermidine synthase [Oricola cellulosilytica]TCD16127.1 spermidine synthase [Oricola cellulosilytica]